MIDFAQLATAAAVGTGTRPVRRDELPPEIAAVVTPPPHPVPPSGKEQPSPRADGPDQPRTADPATVLLDAAAAYAVVRSAAVAPGPDLPAVHLPTSSRPEAPAVVVALLRRIRAGAQLRDELQHELLDQLASRGLGLPPDLLVELLGEVARPGTARDVGALLDDRGWALVGLDPVWSRALARSGAVAHLADPRTWDEGTAAQRAEYLAGLRATDPDAGRALLEAPGFAKEPAETRELLVGALATGLGPADQDFLDTVLGDRAKGVRKVAAELLAGLRASSTVARAEALARQHVERRQRLLRPALTVVSAVPVTAQTRRDQYREKDAAGTPAERLHLFDVIARVPTDRWPALVGATAIELATGPAEYNGSPIDLRPAFVEAALRWRDAELATAVARSDASLLGALLPVLSPTTRDRLLVDAFTAGLANGLMETVVERPLPPELALAVLGALKRLLRGASLYRVAAMVGPLAMHADPLAVPALVDGLRDLERRLPDDAAPAIRRSVQTAAAAAQLRQAVSEALAPYPVLTPDTHKEGRP